MGENQPRESSSSSNSPEKIHLPNSKSNGVTRSQLAKFQELQRRRLKLVSKLKNKKKFKTKGGESRLRNEELRAKAFTDNNSEKELKDPTIGSSSSKGDGSIETLSSSSSHVDVHPVFQKKKLYWGLDSKERWERKANM